MRTYSEFETRRQSRFDESNFNGFNFAIPMKTMVISASIRAHPTSRRLSRSLLGDEVYPGEVVLDEGGNRVGSARTLFTVKIPGSGLLLCSLSPPPTRVTEAISKLW